MLNINNKLNTLTLSGLIVGPVLGSGIIFLPSLAYKVLGPHAIWAWIIMMSLGGLFAYVFAKMTVLTTSNEGMSIIIGKILGNRFRELSSNFLTIAVFFGPAAVVITASDFIKDLFKPIVNVDQSAAAFVLLILCAVIIGSGITAVSRIVLVLSTLTGLLLVLGSLASLYSAGQIILPSGPPDIKSFGHTLLLIFWSIIGWEILGNYIEDVNDPDKTIYKAMKLSLIVIIFVYLITTLALQSYFNGYSGEIRIHDLLSPLLGSSAYIVFSIIASGLCICTILMFVGAVARQMYARSTAGLLPSFLSKKHVSLCIITAVNLIVLAAFSLNWISLEWIVGIANTFFIGNALLGLFSGFLYMKGILIKSAVLILILMLVILLFFSSLTAIILLILAAALSLINKTSIKS